MASIAKSIAEGLLNGILGKFGALIFDKIFPSGHSVPSYFGAVYAEIINIIHQEVTQTVINEVDGEINGLKNWVINTYTPRKEQKSVPKQDLFDMLSPKESNLTIHAIGVLQQNQFAQPGLCVFMIAAGMHLTLLQELAYVDPTVSDPHQSSYVQSIKQYAKEYTTYGATNYNPIEKKRLSFINLNQHYKRSGPGGEGVLTCQWRDDYSGKQGNIYTTYCLDGQLKPYTEKQIREFANAGMQEHISAVKEELSSKMGYGATVDWSKLETQLLPTNSTS